MSSKNFYITSPIFYPNANLHMGHAYVMTLCDVMARHHRLLGDNTYFLTGSDENTAKIIKAAAGEMKGVQAYLDDAASMFESLYAKLGIEYDQFIRTSDKKAHWPGVALLWNKLLQSGDLYKGVYTGLYCVGCETFYTEKDLINGVCPVHETVPEKIKEENYFFKLSRYTDSIRQKIESGELAIMPNSRKNEIMALLERGLDDISFSRPASKIPWGIPVPGDLSQHVYVWCDALANYITALGYGTEDDSKFKTFWPADFHVVGKDILRFHAAIWPAMLMSAGLPLPKVLMVHGLITSGGKKMSKSLGNVIDPNELIAEYGKDALRYYLTREITPFEDGDMTRERFKEVYNAELANGLGNLVSRIMKMSETYFDAPYITRDDIDNAPQIELDIHIAEFLKTLEVNKAMDVIWGSIKEVDLYIQEQKPFSVYKTDPEKARDIVGNLTKYHLVHIARALRPFMPETAEKIADALVKNHLEAPLFLRRE